MFTPISTPKASECIVIQIKQMIIKGELRIGDRLPTELELVQSFGVSRSSLREALKALEAMGVLESRQGGGHYIVNRVRERMSDNLSMLVVMEGASLEDLIQLRRALETETMRSMLERSDEEAFVELEKMSDCFHAATTKEELVRYDAMFHDKILSLSHNRLLQYIYSAISTVYHDSVAYANDSYWGDKSLEHIRAYQLDFFNAIKTRNLAEIEAAIDRHYTYKRPSDMKVSQFEYMEKS